MGQALPCGERVVRCLIGEPVDRVPFGVGIGWWPWGEAMDNCTVAGCGLSMLPRSAPAAESGAVTES